MQTITSGTPFQIQDVTLNISIMEHLVGSNKSIGYLPVALYRVLLGLVNETAACKYVTPYVFECFRSNENTDFASGILAGVALLSAVRANQLLGQKNRKVSLVLNSFSIRPPFGVRFRAEKDAETE